MIRIRGATAAAMFALAAAAGAAGAQDESVEAMEAKVTALEARVKDFTARIDIRLKRKQEDDEAGRREHEKLLSARSELEQRSATMLAAKSELEARCQGELPQAAFDRCSADQGRHNANASALDADIETHNRKARALSEQSKDKTKEAETDLEKLRRDQRTAARDLMTQRQAISERRVSERRLWLKNCLDDCKRRPDDSAKHCEMQCFDNARRQLTPRLETVRPELAPGIQRLESSVDRSSEAIRAYRESGPERPGPQSVRTREVPPP